MTRAPKYIYYVKNSKHDIIKKTLFAKTKTIAFNFALYFKMIKIKTLDLSQVPDFMIVIIF